MEAHLIEEHLIKTPGRLKSEALALAAALRSGPTGTPPQAEKDEPQPQDFVELGLMKLKPCRINVSS
jgi:hypothetical protein